MGSRFVVLFAGIATLGWLSCGGNPAHAQINFLNLQSLPPSISSLSNSRLIARASGLANDLFDYHDLDDDASPLEEHCEAHDVYDELLKRYNAARTAKGKGYDLLITGIALARLGEAIAEDEYIADDYYGGYDSCYCLPFDDYFGPHEVDLSFQGGWMIQQAVIGDFNYRSTGGIAGVGATLMLPLVRSSLPNSYGFLKATWYETNTSTELFNNPDWTSRTNWMATVDFGFGASIPNTNLQLRASIGPLLAERTVTTSMGRQSQVGWGYSTDVGFTYKLSPRWGLTADWRRYNLQGQSFEHALGSDESLSQNGNMFLFGATYRLGGSLK